ncbi:3-oxoacyl-ACP synthase III family protein [Nostoc sp. C117]|uniref:3-oxoacyl-ACP synthase III family protein n=1 Tax=Nostoc sp. C117 TaxID=3349875 RepID=UPI00370DE1EA
MIYSPVGIRSLALSLPSIRRTNDYYIEKHPQLVTQAEQKGFAKLFALTDSSATNQFDQEMLPYLSDPFRGAIERWVLGPGESSLTLEYRAAMDALNAAKLAPEDVELMIVCSVWPEQIGFGNAAFLAGQLGLQGAAWNLDATCGSTPTALQTASALVKAGEYRNVLVVISCTYSRFFDEDDTLPWFTSDGAGAFVVGALEANQGILGTKTVHTAALSEVLFAELTKDKQNNPQVRMRMGKGGNALSETAGEFLRRCCEGAVAAAGVNLDQIDFFLFNTPTAWVASFCTRVLGIDPKRTLNLYPQYANLGPVLTVANLYHATQLGKIRQNDLVLIYGSGCSGAAAANVMRWGNVALGSNPTKESDSVLKDTQDKLLRI